MPEPHTVPTLEQMQKHLMTEILESFDIKLKIDGCGCCGSPGVRMEYGEADIVFSTYTNREGLEVLTTRENFQIDMFKET